MIEDARQLEITQRKLESLRGVIQKLRAKYKGSALLLTTSGPLEMMEQLEGEIREYEWRRHSIDSGDKESRSEDGLPPPRL